MWPLADGRPPTFLGCIDLSRVPNLRWLPDVGLLLFFYDVEDQPWGFDPEHERGWAVLHGPDPVPAGGFVSAPAGLELPRQPVRLEPKSLLPPWEFVPDELALSGEEIDALLDLRDAEYRAEQGGVLKHQLGGLPGTDPGRDDGHRVRAGVERPEGDDPPTDEVRGRARDWRLLLQLDSFESTGGVMWGDSGMLYFWVRDQDAAVADFSRVWVVLQCH